MTGEREIEGSTHEPQASASGQDTGHTVPGEGSLPQCGGSGSCDCQPQCANAVVSLQVVRQAPLDEQGKEVMVEFEPVIRFISDEEVEAHKDMQPHINEMLRIFLQKHVVGGYSFRENT